MSSDTSLVFNLVARDRASATMERMKERFNQAAAGIATGVAAALGVGIAANIDAEAASDKLAAQLGVGPEKAAQLAKVSAKVYGDAWGDSTATVNEAIKGVYQNIGDTSQAEGGLEGVTKKVLALSETFDQDLSATTSAVGQMLKTGLADNADEALDIVTRGLQSGANKADDLMDTINEYGTQWRKFGLDGQTAMGLLSQGLKAGARDADVVADSIKEFSIRAIDGSDSTIAGFKSLGLNADDMAAKISKGGKGAADALDLTLDKLRDMPDKNKRAATAVQLFGTQAEDLGDSLYALDPSHATDALGKVGGAADKMAKTIHDNPAAALEAFKRQTIQKLGEVAGSFVQFAMANQGIMKPLAITLGGIALTILAVKGATMAWSAAQAVWTAATAIATAAQWAWNLSMWAWPGTWIIAAILAVVAIIVLIATKTTWFQDLWRKVWGGIKSAADSVGRWFTGTLWPWIGGVWDKIAGGARGARDGIKSAFNSVVDFFKKMPERISKAASGMWNGIKSSFKGAVNGIIRGWNALEFTVGGGSFMGIDIPKFTLGVPDIPLLAKGGTITGSGSVIVGEKGPEMLSLPTGASVTPLSRSGGGGGVVTVRFDTTGAYDDMLRLIRRMVRVEGRGDVQTAFKPR
ncbi:phage tail tape measure protein [Streptomyces sp. NPDC005970]|uniref:phage tail tape measure protein n=1 Tax=Streptomyces sp. NPDC005970 TaxID=3156723 RepID=UPI0034107E12